MATYTSDDEQLDALKRWWADNRGSVIGGIALAVALSVGWQSWQGYQDRQQRGASDQYQALLDTMMGSGGQAATLAAIASRAEELKVAYPKSNYAAMAALHLARIAVERNELEAAVSELRWILQSGAHEDVKQLAQLRLARVLAAQGEYDAALTTLAGLRSTQYQVQSAMARGDVFSLQGREPEAREAYAEALGYLQVNDPGQLELADRLAALAEGRVLGVAAADTAPEGETE